jgi:hypothetical protein
MPQSVGILVIGSLYWEDDNIRQAWRRDRLRMQEAVDVRAPIRYGRISEGRGNTYTMVFSRGCEPGQAKVVPCQDEVRTPADLVEEAEHLWAAERKAPRNGRINAGWGCVTLLPNPHREIHAEILNGWAARVARARAKPYGNVWQAPGEGVLVNERGILQIAWPTSIADNSPVALDLLLATATEPTSEGSPRRYATAEEIAAAWRKDREDNVRYFRNNVQCGIRTFDDEALQTALEVGASGIVTERPRRAAARGVPLKAGE